MADPKVEKAATGSKHRFKLRAAKLVKVELLDGARDKFLAADPREPAPDGTFIALPVCGFYQLDLTRLMSNSIIQIHAKNTETEEIFSGVVFENDPGIEEPDDEPPLEADEVAGQSIAAYFNPNLPRYVAIPAEPARYQVMVQIGDVRSNIVEVEILGPPL